MFRFLELIHLWLENYAEIYFRKISIFSQNTALRKFMKVFALLNGHTITTKYFRTLKMTKIGEENSFTY